MSSSELLSLLKIQFPEEVLNELKEAWIFLYPLEDSLKMNLVFKTTKNQAVIKTFLNNNEYHLPELLKPLFIDESFVLKAEPITFLESKDLKGIRYYNFVEGVFSKAIDWGIINNNYLILATSKETTLKIIEDLKKEVLKDTPLN